VLLLLTSKLFCVVLFHGRKVSNSSGLGAVSAVRTVSFLWKVPYPTMRVRMKVWWKASWLIGLIVIQ